MISAISVWTSVSSTGEHGSALKVRPGWTSKRGLLSHDGPYLFGQTEPAGHRAAAAAHSGIAPPAFTGGDKDTGIGAARRLAHLRIDDVVMEGYFAGDSDTASVRTQIETRRVKTEHPREVRNRARAAAWVVGTTRIPVGHAGVTGTHDARNA